MSDNNSPSCDEAERATAGVIDVESVPVVQPAAASTAQSPVASAAMGLPAEAHALLEMIGRGLAPDADESARATARELWGRCAHAIVGAAPQVPGIFAAAASPSGTAGPGARSTTDVPLFPLPTSPIAMAAHAIKRMTPDQLLDTLLQRLRAALPAGATVSAPRGIQFQLIPVTLPAKDPR